MKIFNYLVLSMLILAVGGTEARRRCCGHSGSAALGFFAGALTGAAVAHAYEPAYYYEIPAYDIYPGAPLFAYDYPTYMYAPMYAPRQTLYTYPGYYWAY